MNKIKGTYFEPLLFKNFIFGKATVLSKKGGGEPVDERESGVEKGKIRGIA